MHARGGISVLLVGSLLALRAAPAAAQTEPAIPTLSADQVARLDTGEILVQVIEARVPISDTMGIVHAPAQAVLDVIDDFDHYTDFMPDTSYAHIEGRDGEYVLCHGITDTPWPMDDREWTVRAWSGPRTIEGVDVLVSTWDYIPDSGNLVDTEGYWLLLPWGDDGQSTLVRYYLMADLGSWIPEFLISWATEDLLPSFIVALRQRLSVE